jgi:hypothetical protein
MSSNTTGECMCAPGLSKPELFRATVVHALDDSTEAAELALADPERPLREPDPHSRRVGTATGERRNVCPPELLSPVFIGTSGRAC